MAWKFSAEQRQAALEQMTAVLGAGAQLTGVTAKGGAERALLVEQAVRQGLDAASSAPVTTAVRAAQAETPAAFDAARHGLAARGIALDPLPEAAPSGPSPPAP